MNDPDLVQLARWIFEVFGVMVLVGTLLWLKTQLGDLPERLPYHFGITGKPDRWGGRWVIPLLLAVLAGSYIAMSLAGHSLELITGSPGGALTPKQTFDRVMLSFVKFGVTVLMAHSLWTIIRVGRGQAERYNILVPIAFAALTILPAILWVPK